MYTGWIVSAKIKFAMTGGDELISDCIVITQQILAAAHMAEESQDVTVADRKKIRAREIIAGQRKPVAFYKLVKVFPVFEVFRPEKKRCAKLVTGRPFWNTSGGKRIINSVALPYGRIENRIGCR